MDKGPFRGQGQNNKSQPAPQMVYEPEVEKKVTEHMPRTTGYTRRSHEDKSPLKLNKWTVIGVAATVVLILGVGIFTVWQSRSGSSAGIDGSKYQMVKLSDGQSYYGKLSAIDGHYMRLSDVFYLESDTQAGASSEDEAGKTTSSDASQNKYKLLKFTGIYFGPEDEMTISRDQIINYANLDPEGKIVKIIEQFKASNED